MKQKNNPNKRWVYKEVDNLCEGKKQIIPEPFSEFCSDSFILPYKFLGKDYRDISSLTIALASNWEEGKKQLYRGLLSGFFKTFNPEIAGYCLDSEEEASQGKNNDDIIFWNLLYKIYPQLEGFYWKEKHYDSFKILGQEMLEKLWQNNKSDYSYWASILEDKLLSSSLKRKEPENKKLLNLCVSIETAHNVCKKSNRDIEINYYTMAYLLSGEKILSISNQNFRNINELTSYLKSLINISYKDFEKFCLSMISYDNTLNAQFEAWLISLGKSNEIKQWQDNFKNL